MLSGTHYAQNHASIMGWSLPIMQCIEGVLLLIAVSLLTIGVHSHIYHYKYIMICHSDELLCCKFANSIEAHCLAFPSVGFVVWPVKRFKAWSWRDFFPFFIPFLFHAICPKILMFSPCK